MCFVASPATEWLRWLGVFGDDLTRFEMMRGWLFEPPHEPTCEFRPLVGSPAVPVRAGATAQTARCQPARGRRLAVPQRPNLARPEGMPLQSESARAPGAESGALHAYLHASELEEPPRFNFDALLPDAASRPLDHLAPLAACCGFVDKSQLR